LSAERDDRAVYFLAEDGKRTAVPAALLHQKLKNWRESVGAVMPVPNPDYDPATAHEGLTGENPPTSKRQGA